MAGYESMKKIRFEKGSGNVFADLGLPNAGQELLKARLTYEIYRIIEQRKLSQEEAAQILGVGQSYVSDLKRNRSGRFSVGKLFEFLNTLDVDVEVTLKKHPARSKTAAGISVSVR
jgi:predicted XRE-type DNA-binding protein